jgi:mannose-6-phosphate isomerase-like protein (cupin superfamily)
MHPQQHGNTKQSLAEARIAPGAATLPHRHTEAEELYHVTAGSGLMHLGEEHFPLSRGDTLCIPPGTLHWIENPGREELVILCCCSPPYDHADTRLESP